MFFTVRRFCFLLLLFLAQSQLGFGQDGQDTPNINQNFIAVSSLLFRPGTDYKVFFSVNPHPSDEPLQLKCVLLANSTLNTTIESESISLRPGESGQISIPLPQEMPGGEKTWRLFAWSVTEESEKDGYKYEAPHTLIYSSKQSNADGLSVRKADLAAIFIQTDKPVYKPEDLVRIRVITMDSNDLPHLTAGVNMTITDGQGNVMKKWEQPLELPESVSVLSNVSSNGSVALFGEFQKKNHGLSSYEYQLSSEPILGNWTIQVEAGKIKERMYFDVKRYILPKFQVKVEAPSVLYGTGEISTTATINASYTYGKSLHGTATVVVSTSYCYGRSCYPYTQSQTQQFQVKDGKAKVQVGLARVYSHPTLHVITVNVTEKNTGRWQIGNATVRVYQQETYIVEWVNQRSSYKPGLPITVQLKITGQDGFPVKDVREKALSITFPPSLNLPAKDMSIPLSGIATFAFPTPLEHIPANSTLQVQYKKAKFTFTMPTAENATSSGVLIEIIPPPAPINLVQGNSYNFTMRSNQPIQPEVFHCLLWNDAELEVYGAQSFNNSRTTSEFPFSLRIPKAAYTELKVFAYFEIEYEGSIQIISTAKSINTHNYLKIRVSRPIPKKASAPPPQNSSSNEVYDAEISSTPSPNESAEETTSDYIYVEDEAANDDPRVAQEPDPQSKISDKLQVEPGDAVEIHFETYPDSTIAIRGIDQSLLLLTQQDNDLNQEAVQSKRATFQSHQPDLNIIPPDNSTFLQAFRRLGISVLSKERFLPFDMSVKSFGGDSPEEAEMDLDEDAPPDESLIPQVDTRLRTKFPETWLWEEFESSSDSSITVLSTNLPDTLTSWIISGFSLNPQTGLGVASPATITGFMPFFATLNLPYSVVNLETFDLQVIVHNYLDEDVNVWVTLFNNKSNSGFDFVDDRDNKNGSKSHFVKVDKNNAALVHFVITPMEIGEIPIEVKVVTEDGTAGDSISRKLKVKPDGVRETRSQVYMFDAKTGEKHLSGETSFDVKFPEKVVKGASTVQLTVVGNPMGTMTSNLGRLIWVPRGCGEQNMMGLVPNILVLHYLTATDSGAKDVMQKAKRNLEIGYGNQLQYKKSSGGFSVWTYTDATTWLTAYVLQWFVVSQKYITIDDNVIVGATKFIQTTQKSDGSFVEVGPFYHPEMRVGTGSGVGLAAFITLALIKANETTNNDLGLKVAIQNGMKYISRQAVYDLDDNYVTNLVTATLMAGNHQEKDRFFEKMKEAAKTTTNSQGLKVKYWDMKTTNSRASDQLAIEMTSYALLAHLWKKGGTDSSVQDIHRWLLSKRNPNGGFISTQDTMLGLTALTEFALRTKTTPGELDLNIKASNSSSINGNDNDKPSDMELAVAVHRWNRMVLQEFDLPADTKKVNLKANGTGSALVQLTQTWYVPIKNKVTRTPPDHFNITAKMTIPKPKDEPNETQLRVCVNSFHVSSARDSIASIQLPSGYIFYPEDFEKDSTFMAQRPGNVQKFESTEGNTKVDVYYTEIKPHPPTCVSLVASQQFKVANGKNPVIRVYEYLNPKRNARVVYEPAHNTTVCQLCQKTGNCGGKDCP